MNYTSNIFVTNNPQTFLNSYLSGMRNSIISFTLGVGIYGFSKTFQKKKSSVGMRLLSILLYLYALANAFNTNLMLDTYLKKVKKEVRPKEERYLFPDYIDFRYWNYYRIMGYFFCSLLVILFLISTERFFRKLF